MQLPLAWKTCVALLPLAALAGCQLIGPKPLGSELALTSTIESTAEEALLPSNDRDWSPDLAILPYAEFRGDEITIRNVRNCVYESDNDYVLDYYDKQFDLNQIQHVDFIVVPFNGTPSLAHTMLSFGLDNGDYLAVSVEARMEKGETYSPLKGALRQYELMYILADERDVILRRTRHRGANVFVYRTIATPEQSRELFVDVLRRVNELAETPEFYDTIVNNCTTNIIGHLNRIRPGRVPVDLRVLLPGFSDSLAYELGLLDTQLPFQETRRRAKVTELANRHARSPDFSICPTTRSRLSSRVRPDRASRHGCRRALRFESRATPTTT